MLGSSGLRRRSFPRAGGRGAEDGAPGRSHQDVAPGEELQCLERAAVRAEEALAALHEAILVPHLRRGGGGGGSVGARLSARGMKEGMHGAAAAPFRQF